MTEEAAQNNPLSSMEGMLVRTKAEGHTCKVVWHDQEKGDIGLVVTEPRETAGLRHVRLPEEVVVVEAKPRPVSYKEELTMLSEEELRGRINDLRTEKRKRTPGTTKSAATKIVVEELPPE